MRQHAVRHGRPEACFIGFQLTEQRFFLHPVTHPWSNCRMIGNAFLWSVANAGRPRRAGVLSAIDQAFTYPTRRHFLSNIPTEPLLLSPEIRMDPSLLLSCISDKAQIIVTFGTLGVLSHLSILTSEIDSAAGSLLVGLLLSWVALAASFMRILGVYFVVAIANSSLACLSFLTGLGASTVIYRLFFHRLRHFPGPWGAKVSRLYTVWISKRSGFKYHLELEKLHVEFGDFVRTGSPLSYASFLETTSELTLSIGPREISVNRASAVRIIHGPQSKCSKGPWYSQLSDNPNKINLLALRSHEIHRGRRRAWDKGLGTRG